MIKEIFVLYFYDVVDSVDDILEFIVVGICMVKISLLVFGLIVFI